MNKFVVENLHTIVPIAVGMASFLAGILVGKRLPPATQQSRAEEKNGRRRGEAFEIYVGNLPYEMDDAELEKVFGKFGKVVSARVITNRASGASKGYGFVQMADAVGGRNAIAALESQEIHGRQITVNEARSHPRDRHS